MNKLSEPARKLIVAQANELIKTNSSREIRANMVGHYSQLLIACNSYRGFNYIKWLDGGHEQWMKDGKPEDNTPYLGDKTLIRFY